MVMNKTELAIIERIAELDETQQMKVLEFVSSLTPSAPDKSYYLGLWLDAAEHLNAKICAHYGDTFYFNTQALLDELREEASK